MFNRLYQSKNRKKTPSIDGVEVTPEMRMSKSELEQSKMNQRLIVNVLDKIIVLGNEFLNEELRKQLLDAYVLT